MNRPICVLGVCLLFLGGCDRQPAASPAVKSEPSQTEQESVPQPAAPLVVERYRRLDLQSGVQLHQWDIQVNRLKELSATLLVLRDGTQQVASKNEFKWEKWDDSEQPARGQVLLLVEDGHPFGSDKRLPLLSLDFSQAPNGMRSQSASNIMIEGDLQPGASTTTKEGSPLSFPPGTAHSTILHAEVFVPRDFVGSLSLAPNLDTLQKAAESGRIVVAIALEWTPR